MKTSSRFAAAALCAWAVATAQAQQEPGITDKTIKIGVFAPLSGAGMAYGFDVMNAAKMYYAKINKEGGIHGRQLELVIEDDRCNANDLVAAVKKLTEQDKVFMLNGGSCSAAVVAAREYVEREDPAADAERLGRRRAVSAVQVHLRRVLDLAARRGRLDGAVRLGAPEGQEGRLHQPR